jgi:hypothetical protein
LSRTRTIVRSRPAFASRVKVASNNASKNGLDTPSRKYQKVSPLAGDTKAVT